MTIASDCLIKGEIINRKLIISSSYDNAISSDDLGYQNEQSEHVVDLN